ncbi:hypothetical protein N9955_01070 [bacterium]|nr:hypothetical protein [bacterium]
MSIEISLNSGTTVEVYTSLSKTVETDVCPAISIDASLNSGTSITTSQSLNKVIETSKDLSPTNHNNLFLIQGGAINDYYHLTQNQYNDITGFLGGASGYASVSYVDGVSGNLQLQITDLNNNTGSYYLNTNPSGFITGVDLSSYATISYTNVVSGNLQLSIDSLESNTGNYYLNTNPSGFATEAYVDSASGTLQGLIDQIELESGNHYPADNPSGFITGVDLSSYATEAYVNSSSGTLQSSINDLYSNTGNYYLNTNPSGFATESYVLTSSGTLQASINDLYSNTGDYYLNTNPSGFITGFNSGDYATIDFVTGVSGYLQDNIVDLNGYATITGVQLSWNNLVMSWTEEPILTGTVASGEVYSYVYGATNYYRFIPSTYDSTQDSFYGSFSDPVLSNLISTRGNSI